MDPQRACRHVKCVLVGARGSRVLLFSCLPDVWFFDDIGCKREPRLGVSGGIPYLFRHSGPKDPPGPLQAHSFGRFIFASFFVMELYVLFEVILLIFMVLHPHGETFKRTCLYVTFAWFTLSQTHVCCSLLHHFLSYCAPMLGSFWYDFGIKTSIFSIPNF